MARTKTYARKSTGGKAPRRPLSGAGMAKHLREMVEQKANEVKEKQTVAEKKEGVAVVVVATATVESKPSKMVTRRMKAQQQAAQKKGQ